MKTGILNPQINSLISRIRHTNRLVIADRGFPFLSSVETIDISLVDDIPTVLDVYLAVRKNFEIGCVWMADEFKASTGRVSLIEAHLPAGRLVYEPHAELKMRASGAIGLIRTGDTTQYANMIIESA